MKKLLFFPAILILASILFSCNDLFEDSYSDFASDDAPMLNRSFMTKTDKILYYIYLQHPQTRSSRAPYLTPYLYGSDTVMMIANYGDGWDIFSYDERAPMVIASSSHGEFLLTDTADYPSTFIAYLNTFAEQLHDLMVEEADSVQPYGLWQAYIIDFPEKPTPIDSSWKEIDTTKATLDSTDFDRTPKILKFHEVEILNDIIWHQHDPWNHYMILDPVDSVLVPARESYNKLLYGLDSIPTDDPEDIELYKDLIRKKYAKFQCAVGCGPVAVGMFLYAYHHNVRKYPISIPTKGILDVLNNKMSFSGETKTLWNHMNGTDSLTQDSVAIYLGNLSTILCHRFSFHATASSNYKVRDYLNDCLPETFVLKEFNFDSIKQSIDNDMPVIGNVMGIRDKDSTTMAHSFVYRGYRILEMPYGKREPDGNSPVIVNQLSMKWIGDHTDTTKINWDNIWFDASLSATWHWAGKTINEKKSYLQMRPL